MTDTTLKVVSLNCWGLKYVSKRRRERLGAIANDLALSDYDIIALQEVWCQEDYTNIKESVSSRLPYAKFFYSGALGSGLAIFSRFRIEEASFMPYSLNGAPLDVIAGDWFVGKACSSITISHPTLGLTEVFNTHLYAKGGEDGPEHNRAHRLVNAWEFSKLVRLAAIRGRSVIALGDFNSVPTTLPISIIHEHAGVDDAWVSTHTSTLPTGHEASPAVMVDRYGITADSPLNSWSAGKPLDRTARKFMGKRLDYIFYRTPLNADPSHPTLVCKNTKVVFTDNVPGTDMSYSDHFGIEATFEITTELQHVPYKSERISSESIHSTIQALTTCLRHSAQRSKQELTIFAGCLVFLVLSIPLSIWITTAWVQAFHTLVVIALSFGGTTYLYEGFLYGRWERNALKNIIEELELERRI